MTVANLIEQTIAQHINNPRVISYSGTKLNEVQGRFVSSNRVYNFVLNKSGVSYSPAGRQDSLLFSALYLERLDAVRKPKIGNDKCNAGKSYQCGKICLGNRRKCHKGVRDVNDARRIASILASTNEKLKNNLEGSDKAIARGKALFEARGNRERNPKPERVKAKPSTPREAAQSQIENDNDYEFARKSAVSNAGEDLKGSARHNRNQWKGLADAEKNGTAEGFMTRDNLFKIEPHKLMATITPKNAESHLAAHFALKSFPDKPYKNLPRDPQVAEKARQQYFDAYKEIKATAEKAANDHDDFNQVLKVINEKTVSIIKDLRKDGAYSPVSNQLIALHKAVTPWGYVRATGAPVYKGNQVGAKIDDFKKRVIEKSDTPDIAVERAKDIIEGKSFNKAFDTVQSKDGDFKPASLYVQKAERKGGRVIDANTVQSGTKFMIDDIGLRGLQYGNSVTDDERKHHLQKSAEALADLADITGLPDRAISLSNSLGLAIGARGKGNALAHYEPMTKVINLTRNGGVGSLAHEWGHALDNYLAGGNVDTKGVGSFMSAESSRFSPRSLEKGYSTPDPVGESMYRLREAFSASGFDDRLRKTMREMGMSQKQREYWNSTEEKFARCFERHIQHKLQTSDRENTYLVGLRKVGHPLWTTDEEAKFLAPYFDDLLKAVKEKHFSK